MGVEVCEAVATGEDVSLAFGSTQSLRTLGESVVDIIGESAEVASFDGCGGGNVLAVVTSGSGCWGFVVVGERAERFLGSDLVNGLAIRSFRLWGSSFEDDGAMRMAVGTFEDSSASGASVLGFIGGVVGFHPSNLSGGSLGLSRRSR
jgi:hypothetical protein